MEVKESENMRVGGKIRYAEIQASKLRISIAVLMTIFGTAVGQAYKMRCHHSVTTISVDGTLLIRTLSDASAQTHS